MKVLVTGADGFVGQWLARDLLGHGHHVVGAIRLGGVPPAGLTEAERRRIDWVEFDLLSPDSVDRLAERRPDALVHLAAVASGLDARQDPGYAWTVNAAGTARLCEAFGRLAASRAADPLLVIASTGEVYGQGRGEPLVESDPVLPCSPYAASKAGAELAAQEVARRTGLRLIVTRAFPHTGPGQSDKYAIPAIAARMRTAKRIKAPVIKTGNLEPVRDYLDVRDVAAAYRAVITRGRPGAVYNVASGVGRSLLQIVDELMRVLEARVIVEPDPGLARPNDLMHLVGDAGLLRRDTGWAPAIPFEQTLRDLLDAQTD
jgi:GDP-4-dehydro-6-deoxy-D-mannose reductase